MKILLDENLPLKLKLSFAKDHDVRTVREMNWTGKRNGELLGLTAFAGFHAFVTTDKNLQHQQNIERFPIKIFVLDAPNNKLGTLNPYIEKLTERLLDSSDSSVIKISLD
jgi:predicted nuclease of predicted toxin-antitoxin system